MGIFEGVGKLPQLFCEAFLDGLQIICIMNGVCDFGFRYCTVPSM